MDSAKLLIGTDALKSLAFQVSGHLMPKKPPRKNDEPALIIDLTNEMDVDWLRARRLKQEALEGDQAAQAELDRMESTKLTEVKDD
jgi:hypothetical protein